MTDHGRTNGRHAVTAAFLDPDSRVVLRDIEPPDPADGEVVLRVAKTALHHGNLLGAAERPLGSEAVGVVEAVGGGSAFRVGDRVGAFSAWGAVRELIALPVSHVFRVAAGIPDEIAAQVFVNPVAEEFDLARTGDAVARVRKARGDGVVIVEVARTVG